MAAAVLGVSVGFLIKWAIVAAAVVILVAYFDGLRDLVYFIWGKLVDPIADAVQDLIAELVPLDMPDFTSLMPYLEAANAWFPIEETWEIGSLFIAFWGIAVGIRWVLKAIPTIW